MFNSTSTEQFVSIDTIKDDCVILKDGSSRAVIMVAGINFDLKSAEEQDLILGSFQGLLNRLDFSVQFAIHSRKLNIDEYVRMLEKREEEEKNALLRNQIKEYRTFIKTLVSVTNVMSKRFYVVVPYSSAPIDAGGPLSGILSSLPFGNKNKPQTKEEDLEVRKMQLSHRVSSVLSALRGIGVRGIRLNTDELLELYYNLYNPEKKEKKSPAILRPEENNEVN